MAKKGKKNKKRRHQLKKSKGGQVRRQKPKNPGVLPSRFSDDDRPDIVFVQAPRDGVPLVADGYRIVGPAQALVDYAKPLIEKAESEKELNRGLEIAQTCWRLAILKHDDPVEFERMKRKIPNHPVIQDMGEFVDGMIERYYQMFPDTGGPPSFYMKERVIDIEEYEPFDESTLRISEEMIPRTEKEIELTERLEEIDPEDETEVLEWNSDMVDCYAEWCLAKGVPDDKVWYFAGSVDAYLNFLRSYYGEVLSSNMPIEAVREFIGTFYIRKTAAPAWEKSIMPAALKLFTQYLDEKGIISDVKRIRRIVESEQDTFQRDLRLFTDPSLGKKIIPFRRRRRK